MSAYKNFSADLAKAVERSKKDKRLESKKKKALAFLKLIEMNQDAAEENVEKGPPTKIVRHNDGSSSRKSLASQPASCFTDSTVQDTSQQSRSVSVDEEYARAKQAQRTWQKSAEDQEKCRRAQQKAVKYGPNISLTLKNLLPFTNFDNEEAMEKLEDRLPPLFIIDVQHLLLLALLRNFSFWAPRWCRLARPRKLSSVVLVVLRDVSIKDFQEHADSFPFLTHSFLDCVEMVNPTQYNSCVDQDLCAVPLSILQMKRYTKRKDVRERIFKLISKPTKTFNDKRERLSTGHGDLDSEEGHIEGSKAELEPGLEEKEEKVSEAEDEFPRTSLLLSSLQMMEEGYPLPVQTKNRLYADYVFSKEKYTPVTHSSPMFAIDCEMCQTCEKAFELTRVSIVNEQKEVLYDQLVKPYNSITNYLTRYSGMTAELLEPVTKRVEDVRREIRDLLPSDAILCGQSLWNDLNALKMFHPNVIDTSIIFNQSGDRKIKCGLRKLAFNFLGRSIQASKAGHCSIEDARATMDLVKLKLSKDIEFGDAMLGGVYFPNIKTYFRNPTQAQNVEETFSCHPVPTFTDLETFPQSSCNSDPTQSLSKEGDRRSVSCVQTCSIDSEKNVVNGRNRVVQEADVGSGEGMDLGRDNGGKKRQEEMKRDEEGTDRAKEEINQGREEADQCEDEMDQIKEEIDQAKEEINQGREEADQGKDETDQIKEGTDRAKEEINQGREETDRGKDEMDQIKEEIDQAKEEINQGREETDRGKDETDQIKEEIDQAKEEINQGREETDGGKDELDQIKEGTDGAKEEMDQVTEEMNQREVFFQQEGSTKMFNIFEVLADSKISTGLVGSQKLVSRLQPQHKLQCLVVEDDSEACTKALQVHRDKDFTWLELNRVADTLSSQTNCLEDADTQVKKKKLLFSQVDQQVGQFVTRLQERTLVTVVMTGRYCEEQHLNAATFVKIT